MKTLGYNDLISIPDIDIAIMHEVVILINVGKCQDDTYDIWIPLIIPMPQYHSEKCIRTSYLQSGNNYGFAEFENSTNIALTRVFFNGTQYDLTHNLEGFKQVEWIAFERYIYF